MPTNRYCVKCEKINTPYRVSEYKTYAFYYCLICGSYSREFKLIGQKLKPNKTDRFAVLFEEDIPIQEDISYYEILNDPLGGTSFDDESEGWIRFSQIMGGVPVHYSFNGRKLIATQYSNTFSIYQEYLQLTNINRS